MTENWIDMTALVLIGLSLVMGIWRGLFQALFGIMALIVGFYLARQYAYVLIFPLKNFLGDVALVVPLAYLIVFLICLTVFGVVSSLFRRAFRGLGGLDTFGGALFGLARGWAFATIFVLLISMGINPNNEAWAQARTVPYLGATFRVAAEWAVGPKINQWVEFDKQHRPRVIAAPGLPTPKKGKGEPPPQAPATDHITKYHDTIDDLTEEAIRQGNNPNQVATEMALEGYRQRKQDHPLQPLIRFFQRFQCKLNSEQEEECE